jgi:DNA invertase Pin-like site-specific DNA recombinase
MKKAFAYLRVSGKGQVAGDGFPRQREAIARYAKRRHIHIVKEFIEHVSGTSELAHREALGLLCQHLDANGVRLVLVERADRIARDLMVSEVLLQQFRERGVQVIECEGGTELTVSDNEPTRVLIRQVLAAVAQFDKTCLVLKLQAARIKMRNRVGRCEGVKPYGFFPREGQVVQRIKELRFTDKLSLQRIANVLNAEPVKYPTRHGARWSKALIKVIVDRLKEAAALAAKNT